MTSFSTLVSQSWSWSWLWTMEGSVNNFEPHSSEQTISEETCHCFSVLFDVHYIYIAPLLYLICNIHYNNLSASHFFVLSNGYKSFSLTFLFRTRLFGITIIRKAIVHSFIKNYLILRTMVSFTINLIIPTFWKGCLALGACEASCMVIALANSQNLL